VDVVITEWALQSYIDLKGRAVFTDQDYWNVLRPDVELLKGGIPPTDPKFSSDKFWGPAKDAGRLIPDAYKMKWRNLGPGKVQMRLLIVHWQNEALLLQAYVKGSAYIDLKEMGKLKHRMNLIALNRHQIRGRI